MYILISKDLDLELLRDEREALQNILECYKNGHHVVSFENRTLTKLFLEIFKNDNALINIILNIHNKHQDNISLLKKIGTHILVSKESYSYFHSSNGILQFFQVPLKHFQNNLSECSFVTENTSDATFYSSLAEKAKRENVLIPPIVKLAYSNDSGGGSQISQVLEQKAKVENRITICFSDSDKTSEDSSLGDTAKSLLSKRKSLEKSELIFAVKILEVREKENLVPPSYYIQHNNFKNSASLQKMSKLEKDQTYHNKLKFIKLSSENTETNAFFTNHLEIQNTQNCYIGKHGLAAFTKDVLLVESMRTNKLVEHEFVTTEFHEKMPQYLRSEHINIISVLLSWTCSYGRMRLSN